MTVTDHHSGLALRVLAVLGTLAMTGSLLAQPAQAQEPTADPCAEAPASTFTDREDIPPAHQGNVDCAAEVNIVQGFEDGTFRPQLQVRRDQMASFIALTLDAAGVGLPAGEADTFTDVGDGNIHADNVNRLAAAGIVQGGPLGLPADEYGPGLRTRRDQMASFLMRAAGYALHDDVDAFDSPDQQFTDVPPGNTHFTKVNGAAEQSITQGMGGERFAPGQETRRDQMASFVVRLLGFVLDAEDGPRIGLTLDTLTGPPGTQVNATMSGDVDRVESVAIAGDCVQDGDVTVAGGAFTFDVAGDAEAGACEVTFTVTFDDDSTQVLRGTFGVVVDGPAVGLTVAPTTGRPGTTVTVTVTGDVALVASVAVTGACVQDGDVTLADDTFTFDIAADAVDGACEVTFTVTFDDGSTRTFTSTFDVADTDLAVSIVLTPPAGTRDADTKVRLTGEDVDEVDAVAVAGPCVEAGDLTLVGEAYPFAIADDAPLGACEIIFTVTFDDGSTQTLTGLFEVRPQVSVELEPTTGPGGTTVTATLTAAVPSDVDEVTGVVVTGDDCVQQGGSSAEPLPVDDGTFTFLIAPDAEVGECAITFGVRFRSDPSPAPAPTATFVVEPVVVLEDWVVALSWVNEVDTPPGETPDIGDTTFRQGEEGTTGQATLVVRETADGSHQQVLFELDASAVTAPFCDGPGAHIHQGGVTENGPVRVFLATCAELDANGGVVSGVLTDADFSGGVTIADVVADPEDFYVNVHSDAFPPGAIRGQLPDGGQSLIPAP
ncbi:MAG: S-layer homology domain-containing protein [Egibacteraceae bacterium]